MTVTTTGVPAWYDDLCGCLQIGIGCALERHGFDPVQALGTSWRFRAPSPDVEPVEFYHPAGNDLGALLGLYQPIRLAWHRPAGPEQAHEDLVAALDAGAAPLVAVDNFYLPFRPAYGDVHAGHLIRVDGYDAALETYQVDDPMPPAYRGPLPRQVLERARGAGSPADAAFPIFSGSNPAWRWLEVRPLGGQPALTVDWLAAALRANLRALAAPTRPDEGVPGFRGYLARLAGQIEDPDAAVLRDVYVAGWAAQAEASLHARLLWSAADELGDARLAELGRAVELVANGWTGLRVTAAHAAEAADAAGLMAGARQAVRHGERLARRWDDALDLIAAVTGAP